MTVSDITRLARTLRSELLLLVPLSAFGHGDEGRGWNEPRAIPVGELVGS